MEPQTLLVSLPLAAAAGLLYSSLFGRTDDFSAFISERDAQERRANRGILLRIFAGPIKTLGEVIATLPIEKNREELRKKLIQAGSPGGLSVDEFHAARIIAVVVLGLSGAYIDFEMDLTPALMLGLSVLGIFYPDIWLRGYIEKRKRRIFRDLPDTLDTLRLAVDAGMDFGSAMGVVVEKGRPGPLLYELERVERDMSLGRTRQEALRDFATRLQMPDINTFVLALIQADQLGASIGPILKVQSEMARKRRWQIAETVVNKLPMKMLGPLVVFIFPASFIILFTPLLIQWFSGE
ncbi:type II secretion system F family protein [bacterium]|nr:type II secretion system F family protein [bacterium]